MNYFSRPGIPNSIIGKSVVETKINKWINLMCKILNVTPDVLFSKSRKSELVMGRQLLMRWIKIETGLSLKKIGLRFGFRDHTTILHGIATWNDLLDCKDKPALNLQKRFEDSL